MKKVKIFLSHNENSYDAGMLIKNEMNCPCEVVYIEDFVKNNNYNTIDEDDIIHFSCNSCLVYNVMEKIKNINCFIFNKEFIEKKYGKREFQLKLKDIGIDIPKIYTDIKNLSFPIFLKENSHTGIIIQAFTQKTVSILNEKFNDIDYYYEESLTKKREETIEGKYYYSDGSVYAEDGHSVPKGIIDICNKIKNNINIDIYSIDVITKNEKCFVIDFNSSVGFYSSKYGRKGFINMVSRILKDSNEN